MRAFKHREQPSWSGKRTHRTLRERHSTHASGDFAEGALLLLLLVLVLLLWTLRTGRAGVGAGAGAGAYGCIWLVVGRRKRAVVALLCLCEAD